MKEKLILASNNKHKAKEFLKMLEGYEILTLNEIGFYDDIDETGETCEENAKIKTMAIQEFCEKHGITAKIISDDTGLFVPSLNGEPGVHSARYAGNHDDIANRKKLINNLKEKQDKNAYFKCVICLYDHGEYKFFEGRTYGKIISEERGENGFGYDPIFLSDDLNKTFAEASESEKNSVSHRGRAIEKLKIYLNS